ncbi:Zn-dependent hydrolase [Rhizobium sp. AC44/96]|uniref:MBL fold metallo-hydrolase n=1 Tax=Rhizobium sp. AC44/96 TaxID=1841654 RepID=UPI00080F87A1|nr:MBL fold metallo-hydrolase [Rhizobium sp. AC44/96]OCJ10912.1 Zn-dependent hydrolase [Rhizobium sp. AC44/96]
MRLHFLLLAMMCLLCLSAANAAVAQEQRRAVSQCQAVAEAIPKATFISFAGSTPPTPAGITEETVKITYVGHSTFLIETPGGISIATDYSGWYTPPRLPTVVTMNRAHSSHYTLTPDPGIRYVLHGWSDVPGEKPKIDLTVGDTYIRNVTTDIRGSYGTAQPDANSIFIFEVAGLCIGHLGHLHYELTEAHYTEIGRLDIIMVPVDGGLTMGEDSMSRVVKRLRSSLILPMHQPRPLKSFLAMFGPDFDITYAPTNTITVSMRTLPKKPLIYVAQGMQ